MDPVSLSPQPHQRWPWVVGIIAVGGLAVVLLTVALLERRSIAGQPMVPKTIAERILFPLYLPSQLPKGYSVPSVSFREQDGVLLFYASKGNDRISFSEQSKPQNFDFTAFHQKNITQAKSLQDVPYPSVLGEASNGNKLLSVTTDTTWLLITSKTASEDELRLIAERLKRL
jgi:hypothetical protein